MLRFSPRLLVGLALAVLCPWPSGAAERAPKAEELLARYEAFMDGLRVIGYDYLETEYSKGGAFADWTWTATVRSFYARAGERWRILIHRVGFDYYEGHEVPFDLEQEKVFDGKSYIIVNRDDRGARSLSSMDPETARRRLVGGGGGPVETTIVAEVDADKPAGARQYAIQNETSVLYGHIRVDGLFLTDLLRSKTSQLTVATEMIDGRRCDVLKGGTSHGTVTLWLDPAANHAPIRMQMRKAGNDLMGKTPMRLQKATNYKGAKPNLPLREFELQVDFRPTSIEGQTVIAGYVRRDRFIYEGGPEYSIRIEASLDHIRLVPKPEELEPTVLIPEETSVYVRNAPGLRAKWSGGKLVMGYDQPTVASLKANWVSEQGPPALWRRPLVLTTAALLTLAAGVLVWRYFLKGAE
ncbi:MAG: hypothetical protein ACHRXM_11965 [Isosphaerales bacterium]